MINKQVYSEIRRRIKQNIVLNNGYQLDDLVQDTIFKLISNKKNTDSDCIRQSVTIARNILIDYHRKQRKFKECQDIEPEKVCYQTCRVKFIIPEQYNELYILRYKFKYKYEEISKILGMPIGTVKGQIFRMKKEIKLLNDL